MSTRRFFSLIILFCISATLSAQLLRRDFERELSVGVTGGTNMSRVSFLHNDTYRMNELGDQGFWPKFRLGVVARHISQSHFGVQLEFNYVRSGWSERFREDAGMTMVNGIDLQNVKISRTLDYLEIPVLAHIYFGSRRVRVYVELGPQVSFLTNYGSLKWNIPETDTRKKAIVSDDPRLGDEYRSVDYGIAGGMGVDILAGRFHVLLGGRYSYGFRDLYGNSKSDVFQRSNNQLMSFSASFLVPVLKYKENKR